MWAKADFEISTWQRRKLFAVKVGHTVRRFLLNDLTTDHLVIECIAVHVGCKMNVKVWNSIAEDVDVPDICISRDPQSVCRPRHRNPKGAGFITVERMDMSDVALKFEVGQASHLG